MEHDDVENAKIEIVFSFSQMDDPCIAKLKQSLDDCGLEYFHRPVGSSFKSMNAYELGAFAIGGFVAVAIFNKPMAENLLKWLGTYGAEMFGRIGTIKIRIDGEMEIPANRVEDALPLVAMVLADKKLNREHEETMERLRIGSTKVTLVSQADTAKRIEDKSEPSHS